MSQLSMKKKTFVPNGCPLRRVSKADLLISEELLPPTKQGGIFARMDDGLWQFAASHEHPVNNVFLEEIRKNNGRSVNC